MNSLSQTIRLDMNDKYEMATLESVLDHIDIYCPKCPLEKTPEEYELEKEDCILVLFRNTICCNVCDFVASLQPTFELKLTINLNHNQRCDNCDRNGHVHCQGRIDDIIEYQKCECDCNTDFQFLSMYKGFFTYCNKKLHIQGVSIYKPNFGSIMSRDKLMTEFNEYKIEEYLCDCQEEKQ